MKNMFTKVFRKNIFSLHEMFSKKHLQEKNSLVQQTFLLLLHYMNFCPHQQ